MYPEFLAGMQIHVDIPQRKRECIVPTQPVHIHLILSRVEAFNLFKFIKLFSVTNIAQLCRNPLIPRKLPHLSPFLPPSPPSSATGELPSWSTQTHVCICRVSKVMHSAKEQGQHSCTHSNLHTTHRVLAYILFVCVCAHSSLGTDQLFSHLGG